jgi:DNA mismatch repair protein MutL
MTSERAHRDGTSSRASVLTPHTSHPIANIQILSPEVVERIAAGEVVERPVSVVRELIDNALDAGAQDIRVEIRGGGLRFIRVADDGTGIPADQVELAFRHHATSKIRDTVDLLEVRSLGFRGEALPSIAAVSELSILTATGGSPMGVRLDVRYGEITQRSYLSRTAGTTITVRNLFGNTPARLAFVGSARSESTLISQIVRRYALANPTVRFHLTLDGHPSLHTSGLGLEQTIGEAFGSAVSRTLLPIGPVEVGPARWSGFITGRHLTRSSRRHITVLINGRCVQSRGIQSALEDGYRSLLPRGRHPIAVLALQLPRSRVDVNVHPSKQEVKVQEETTIAAALRDAVRETLGRRLDTPSEDVSFALGPVQVELPRMIAERDAGYDATGERLRRMQVIGQVQGSLIVLQDEAGFYLVDQHRAHERAIYELLLRQHDEGRAGQLLLEPLHIELTPHQIARLEPRLPELAALGFSCEWFGGRSFLVRSVPALPDTAGLPALVEDVLEAAAEDESDWQHRLLTSVACRTATRRGRPLTIPQAKELIDLLADTSSPAACPHGSPLILHFSERFLERQFNW